MIDFLQYDGRPIAVPAFRLLAILEGTIHAPPNRERLAAIYALFEQKFGEVANVTSYNFPEHAGKIRWMNSGLLEDGRSFFTQKECGYGHGLRRYGYALEHFEEPALPYFGIEQRSDLALLEIDIPSDADDLEGFADAVTDQLVETSVVWGVMGLGMFLPPFLSSLEWRMGGGVARYRTSIEISPSMVMDGLRQKGSAHRWEAGEEPGIPDIGWRTFVGKEFLQRIPDAASALERHAAIRVVQTGNVLAITAGNRPIWGDVEAGEDIAAYRTIAEELSPIAYPPGAAKAFMFGGDVFDPAHLAKVEIYLNRLSGEDDSFRDQRIEH